MALALPGLHSLKEKRSVVRRLLDRIRSRFHVSAAEVDEQDVHTRAVLGFCTVGADGRKIAAALQRVIEFIDESGHAQIVSVETEVVNYDELGDGPTTYAEKFGTTERSRVTLRPGTLGFGSSEGGDS